MFDYKLQVFLSVAMRLSFSKAAEDLHITQPAITRHIKLLEEHFNQKLFERKGNSIALTKAGDLLVVHSKRLKSLHEALQFDMNALIDKTAGELRISASTTIAQYVLPMVLADFRKKYPKIKISLNSDNTEKVEQNLLQQNAEIGFIEGQSKNRELAYHEFLRDEIVLVVAKGHSLYNAKAITSKNLQSLPMILREKGSGTLEFISNALKAIGIPMTALQVEIHLGSSESIKSYLKDRQSVAFLSVNSVLDELASGDLGIVDVENFSIERPFNIIFKHGHQSSLSQLFLQFIQHHYNINL
ncbi:LysR family transcriptional regulator [Subsaximicrobium wynnwilliamsii]|jgi:DNA-binding transcriptional LysR family regulator|uniref:LysR family transcriptional regulator n=1 Tax=Subsaximicrobium wynnwilliamsii TaxID=291179 RepID=A0A5C6ZFT2_9FLAO|nr:LysR substrate-binding domain-containing protein [Subsaximicrobium wynnwilliamsii]TXD84075.1 LysR family transcriptional regulator [Subsaximicrobium wynnwilliamsii]TXD88967.1 LysR family transcriptional regulator [Subsaximicrobium wynnwilliamsii]TXE03787.1 LysR family transcriptional regulator [Subsaximicrobium wynnwilliamsii]